MTQQLWTAVDDYINDLFISSDPVLEATLAASEAAGLPSISVSPTEGKLLMLLARLHGARTILEIGTLGGYSTIWLARALPAGGTLITLEASPKHAEVAIANIARAGLGDVVDVRVGPALETLPILAEARAPFDLIFIYANKENYTEYLTWALKLSRRGTLIITDNVIRDGEVLDTATSDPRIEGTRRFHQQLASEPRVSATIMQTVGRKGYDGIAIAIVVADQ
jgi:predicted O-methyltransferase YrrM